MLARAESFDPRSLTLATARSLLAVAELAALLANPDWLLFGRTSYGTSANLCTGISHVSLWCVADETPAALALARGIATVILAATALGLWPRWLCIPHWYIAFSLGERMTVLNGGEEVAQILTLLLIPLCLGDHRVWHWRRPRQPLAPRWRGSAYAAHVLLRAQVAIIYGDAAMSKLLYPAWREGTAVRTLFNDPQFGLPPSVRPTIDHLLAPDYLAAASTWGVLTAELCVAMFVLGAARFRRVALYIGLCLHVAIMLAMGLPVFSLIMISLLLAVAVDGSAWAKPLRPAVDLPHQDASRTASLAALDGGETSL